MADENTASKAPAGSANAAKPAKALHVGQRLTIQRGEERFEVDVLALADARGPATTAQALYRETDVSRVEREAAREQRRLASQGYHAPDSKPDKRARRLIRALGDLDAL